MEGTSSACYAWRIYRLSLCVTFKRLVTVQAIDRTAERVDPTALKAVVAIGS